MTDRRHLQGLIAGGWGEMAFRPFRPGVDICRLVDGGEEAASVALLRYRPGASVPWHRHPGLETIIILEGSQEDEHGRYRTGDVVFNRPGTAHSVRSEEGCVVLIHWERPVRIVEEERETRTVRK